MAYTRKCSPFGGEVTLRAIFTDGCGDPIDVDDLNGLPDIDVAVYTPNGFEAVVNIDTEIEDLYANAFTTTIAEDDNNALNGVFTAVTKLATGYYEITYTLPQADSNLITVADDVGVWRDIWRAKVNGIDINAFFSFVVEEKGIIQSQRLYNNTLVVIVLDKAIADVNGNSLEQEEQLTFSTAYNPYYASVDLLRMECGSWLDGIPDDTLSLMIHWSSIEADGITGKGPKGRLYTTALAKFVLYDSAVRCLMLPADVGGKTKSLGDLLIETTSDFSSVILDLKDKREEWFRVVNAGGNIVPGQGLAPSLAVKRSAVTEQAFGRMWHDPSIVHYGKPSQNSRFALPGTLKKRHGWKKR